MCLEGVLHVKIAHVSADKAVQRCTADAKLSGSCQRPTPNAFMCL